MLPPLFDGKNTTQHSIEQGGGNYRLAHRLNPVTFQKIRIVFFRQRTEQDNLGIEHTLPGFPLDDSVCSIDSAS